MEDARACGYMAKTVAQSLRKNKRDTIGLMMPSLSNHFFAGIASTIIQEANSRGCTTIVVDSMENEENQKQGLQAILSHGVGGIIVAPCGSDKSLFEEINANHCPLVLIDRYFEKTNLSYVSTNNYEGGLEGTRYLISMGHKNITCIQGVKDSITNRMRVRGYDDEMRRSGLDACVNVVGDAFSLQNGYVETMMLLKSQKRPTAIFALSNTIAIGAIKAIREAGLSIPDDISILSFDNNLYLDYMDPAITFINQPIEDMARLASKILFSSINSGQENFTHLQLTPSLIIHDSVKQI